MLKITAAAGAAGLLDCTRSLTDRSQRDGLGACADTTPVDIETADGTGCPIDADLYPTSPFILDPFRDALQVPRALRPGYRNPDGTLAAVQSWNVRQLNGVFGNFTSAPGPGVGQQDSIGDRPMANDGKTYTFFNPKTGVTKTLTLNFGGARAGTHQLYPGGQGVSYARLAGAAKTAFDALSATPLLFHVRVQVAEHAFTTSDVQPIDANGQPVAVPAGASATAGSAPGTYKLPRSTIYGYNGTFPGPMINAEYGRPVIVRFENDLDFNPGCLDRQDFGSPDWAFLTHLENGHTAPESDGNPNHLQDNRGGYQPGQWVDNLYLGYAPGGDAAEKQSFHWLHDLRMDHAAANVYKGLVGLMPQYDPATAFNPAGIDGGDETSGLRLPGVRTDHGDGSFDVEYDVPLVLSDCRLDDGLTPHEDTHQPLTAQPWSANVCGETHPEWWGKLFHQHAPNHGFVGDVMTVNGSAFPVLKVKRRRYRFRFLDAALSRQFELSLRQGGLVPAPGKQGQWTFGAAAKNGRPASFELGTLCMKMTQIASDGGLLPSPVLRDSLEVWPSKRREVVIDFSTYLDGKKTKKGDRIYLTNTAVMTTGRSMDGSLTLGGAFAVPLLAFEIDSNELVADASDPALTPVAASIRGHSGGTFDPGKVLRPRHTPPLIGNTNPSLENMDFTFQRGGAGGETQWLVNGLRFDPLNPLWATTLGASELWGVNNAGGGWTTPFALHAESHQVVFRTGNLPHPEDPMGKEDAVALGPSEQSQIWRGFRTFLGNYVARSGNLSHGDHRAMFGWAITL